MAKQFPMIGAWYQDVREDLLFEVVAVDESAATIEIQLIGGEVGEVDFDTWNQMILLHAEAPEDWRASYELSSEDSQNIDDIFVPSAFQDPLSAIESDTTYGLEDY